MTTTLGPHGQIVIPKPVRDMKGLRPGDDFEVYVDEEEPDVIRLKHVQHAPNAGLVDHLLACPHKGPICRPERRREGRSVSAAIHD